MKFTFETDDRDEFEIMMKSNIMYSAIWDIDNFLRSQIKHGNHPEEFENILIQIREMLPDLEK